MTTATYQPCGAAAREAIPADYIEGYNSGNKNSDTDKKIHAKVVKRFKVDGVAWEGRLCKNCGGYFECPAVREKDFGDTACRMGFLQRRQRRGLFVIDEVMRWRGNRKDPTALADLCAKISLMLDQDRKLGRPSW